MCRARPPPLSLSPPTMCEYVGNVSQKRERVVRYSPSGHTTYTHSSCRAHTRHLSATAPSRDTSINRTTTTSTTTTTIITTIGLRSRNTIIITTCSRSIRGSTITGLHRDKVAACLQRSSPSLRFDPPPLNLASSIPCCLLFRSILFYIFSSALEIF